MLINGRLKNGDNLGSWTSGEDGYKVQETKKGEAMEQGIKWLAFNMGKREIKVRQSLMA
jgi:hypothetical protein